MQTWRKRQISLRMAVLIMIVVTLVTTELLFDWAEKSLGAYLVTTNNHRPKLGAIWEQGRQSDSARQTLAQYANDRRNTQRQVRRADTLGQLLDSIDSVQGAMVSASRFLDLYLKLPPVLSNEIVSPYTLLSLTSSSRWQRTFLERQDNQVLIYLLDGQNQVIHRLTIGSVLRTHVEHGEVAIRSGLDQLSEFAGHIYPAEKFFASLNRFPRADRERIIAHPEVLLRISGAIRRVGISEATLGEAVDLGFEVDGLDGPRVILMQGVNPDVRRLQNELDPGTRLDWSLPGEDGR